MPRDVIKTDQYHVPLTGFTPAVQAPGSGRLIFVSGLTARQADGTLVGIGDAAAQARQILENLKIVLAAAGATLDDVVRIGRYLRDFRDHPKVHAVLLEYFGDPLPASTAVEVSRLYDERMLVEIEATAVVAGP